MKRFSAYINELWEHKPLSLILTIGLVLRMISVIFSHGFGMLDDHFLVIEPPASWVEGADQNNWLPWNQEHARPSGHSMFYPGLHFLYFTLLKFLGITEPVTQMYLNRFLHAIFSLLTVFYGFKITQRLSDTNIAKQTALILAAAWFMPFLSVRNLVEIVCIPFMMAGTYLIIKSLDEKKSLTSFFIAGLVIGFAFSIRLQTVLYIGGLGLALLILQKWKEGIVFGLGFVLNAIIIQGIPDYLIWGYPFAEFIEYFAYNVESRYGYFTGSPLMYIEVLAGIFLFPLGLALLVGFFASWRKYLILFLPTVIFLLFHSMFPNKQERFILPVMPMFLMLGMMGYYYFASTRKTELSAKLKKHMRVYLIAFWCLNLLLLPLISTAYSKRSRVESMVYLSKYRDNIHSIFVEESTRESATMLPLYYLGKWIQEYQLGSKLEEIHTDCDSFFNKEGVYKQIKDSVCLQQMPGRIKPEYILFVGDKDLDLRIEKTRKLFPLMEKEIVIEPGLIDKIMHWLNKYNKNVPVIIYKSGIKTDTSK